MSCDKVVTGAARRRRKAKPKSKHAAFDLWLSRQLNEFTQAVAAEPLPERLLKLVTKASKPEK